MRRAEESTRDAGNWLFVVSVAGFALGLILVTAGLVPPQDRQDVRDLLLPGLRRNDTTSMVRANDHDGSGSHRRKPSTAMPASPADPAPLTRPAASPAVHQTKQESGFLDDDFSRRTYLLDSAIVAHGYLVPRPNTDQVD